MMRKLLFLVPWMVLASSAFGQVRSADVLYTHFDSAPTRAYRVGDEVFVALDDTARWGWSSTIRTDLAFIKAEGVEFMAPTRTINGRITIPLVASVKKAGGYATWDSRFDMMRITSDLVSLRVQDGYVKLYSAFETEPRVSVLENPRRMVIDLPGCVITPKTQLTLDSTATATQVRPDVVRVTITSDVLPDLGRLSRTATHSFEVNMPKPSRIDVVPTTPVAKVIDPPKTDVLPTKVIDPPDLEVLPPLPLTPVASPILPLTLVKETSDGLFLAIPLATPMTGAAQARRPEPEVLEVTLPGIAMILPLDFHLDSDSIRNVSRTQTDVGTVIRFEFTRPMAAELVTDGNTIRITAIKPSLSGSLAGKVIVVDPGHGGKDSGTKAGGVLEKDLNLIMGKLIARELTNNGATVIMTRKTDVFIPLTTRAQIANDSDADLFISSHINSTGNPKSTQSGSITFHHKGKEIGKLLAECIHREIAKVSGLPSIGVWSDGKIYDSGFSVLRQTTMPGVLLELGFINSPSDRKRLIQDDFQQKVAAAVVKGIKVFLGNGQ